MRALWLWTSIGMMACASSQSPTADPAPPAATSGAEPEESLPMACTRGFVHDQASGKSCEATVPSRGGLCFDSTDDACECACGQSGKAGCTLLYSSPPQAVCQH